MLFDEQADTARISSNCSWTAVVTTTAAFVDTVQNERGIELEQSSTEREDDQEDWYLEILQAMVTPSTAEDAALACAAAWMNFGRAEQVSVVVFISTIQCVVAHGQQDDGHLTVYVGSEKASIGYLLNPERLARQANSFVVSRSDIVLCWPEHLSIVFAAVDEDTVPEDRLELLQTLSRQLLSRWTVPQTSFANPAHMESMAEFAAGAGHEINNPLASIIGQSQLLLKQDLTAEQKQAVETIGAQAWRVRDMIGDTMLFARPPAPEFKRCHLASLVQKVVDVQKANNRKVADAISFSASDENLFTFGDDSQLSNLVGHLIRNSIQAVQSGQSAPDIQIQVRQDDENALILTVSDNGEAIPDSIRKHMFDPFFSGRQAGRGLGFGLCHCWQIARMHNGVLTHEALPGRNQFVVVLPLDK